MELNEFIEKFADALDLDNVSDLNCSTEFKELDEWSSLAALDILSMIDDEMDVTLTGRDIRGVNTIEELFDLANSRK